MVNSTPGIGSAYKDRLKMPSTPVCKGEPLHLPRGGMAKSTMVATPLQRISSTQSPQPVHGTIKKIQAKPKKLVKRSFCANIVFWAGHILSVIWGCLKSIFYCFSRPTKKVDYAQEAKIEVQNYKKETSKKKQLEILKKIAARCKNHQEVKPHYDAVVATLIEKDFEAWLRIHPTKTFSEIKKDPSAMECAVDYARAYLERKNIIASVSVGKIEKMLKILKIEIDNKGDSEHFKDNSYKRHNELLPDAEQGILSREDFLKKYDKP